MERMVMANDDVVTVDVPTSSGMRRLGESLAAVVTSGDVVLLSGPLGAGKTTFAQGIGKGLGIDEPIVSPTFTIARELSGRFASGAPARLVHVDAYRIGGVEHAPGSDVATALLDELESLGLDEELESPSDGTVVLMEWGEHMAGILSDERLEISIDRSLAVAGTGASPQSSESSELTSDGLRHVRLSLIGSSWQRRAAAIRRAASAAVEGAAPALGTDETAE
jgi:tRNA threonylcarbamoyladenosine biosynthesis protein TsaE